jgi:hypothetical protein
MNKPVSELAREMASRSRPSILNAGIAQGVAVPGNGKNAEEWTRRRASAAMVSASQVPHKTALGPSLLTTAVTWPQRLSKNSSSSLRLYKIASVDASKLNRCEFS